MAEEAAAKATIRTNIFNTILTTLNANKLSGWTVLAAFPEQNPVFPCIVVNPAELTLTSISLDKSKFRWRGSILLDVYSHVRDGKDKNDQGMDNVMDTLRTTSLEAYNIVLDNETPFVDEGAEEVTINDDSLNTNSITLNFVVRL